jgi:hypothetical protein
MKTDTKIILLLLLLPPVLGELLSGSSPPLEFFTPFSFFSLIAFYGGSTLLIREARARWKLQWSIGFLVIAYGILEEGVMMQSFFNFNHGDLGALSRYGMYGGVQWPWTLGLILYHVTISTLIPLAMVELIWPAYTYVSVVKTRGLLLAGAAVSLVIVMMMMFVWSLQKQFPIPYVPNPLLLVGSCCVIGVLIWLAYRFRLSRIQTQRMQLRSPLIFACFGFGIQVSILGLAGILAANHVPAVVTILLQSMLIALIALFVYYQLFHKNRTHLHVIAFIVGSLFFYILLTPVQEFVNKSFGMVLVGIISFVGLMYWRKAVLKKERTPDIASTF